MSGHDWADIRRRTVRVRAALADDRPLTPLTGDDLAEAERQFGVRLPEEYRRFLLEVDSGGPGPVIMRRLVRTAGRWGWENDPDTDLTALATPFPDQEVFDAELDEFCRTPRPQTDEAAQSAWDRRETALLRSRTSGAVYLGSEGHGFSLLLIVSGRWRGEVWFDQRPTTERIIPLPGPDGTPTTFAGLYLDWLGAAEGMLAGGRSTLRLYEIRSPIYETRF